MPNQSLAVPQVYSFLNYHLIVAGAEIVDFAGGENVIECAFREDQASDMMGADGNMAVIISANKSGSVKFKLQGTSRSNQFLNNLAIIQGALQATAGKTPVSLLDTARQDKGGGVFGYIVRPPPIGAGEKPSDREWEIVVQRLDVLMGLV